jgi:signal transduction histidine kinase
MADIAHELRTPVAVLQGRVEGILDGVYPADSAHLRQLVDETRMLGRLVEDLRTSAHAECGTLALRKEPSDLGVLIEDVAQLLTQDAARRNLRLITAASPELPIIELDPHRIREVLVNLVSNAIRHAREGIVEITAECGQAGISLRVMDRGAGIPPQDLSRVFDRFYKGPASTGSGLGLTIAKSLVAAHGGTIVARNRDGGGTIVIVTLPASTIRPGSRRS